MSAYVLVMTHADGWQSVIDAGYCCLQQAEVHGVHLCQQLPEEYTGYEVMPSDGQTVYDGTARTAAWRGWVLTFWEGML